MGKRKLTRYNIFVRDNLPDRIKEMGSAKAAMKQIGKEWRERKNR